MSPIVDPERFVEPLRPFLPRQRWYSGGTEPASIVVNEVEVLQPGFPTLLDLLVDADGVLYQVLIGLRPSHERPDFLRGRDEAVLGEVEGDAERLLAYDAVLDPDLDLCLLDVVAGGKEVADHVRPLTGEQSNSSMVFDDRLILKVFRRLHPGRNLDVEMTEALGEAGFEHVAPPVATFTRNDYDLAVVQPFLAGGADGWALALTSLRDLFGVGDTQPVPVISFDAPPPEIDPGEAGGDFSAEARRLGAITAEMHAALDHVFGRTPGSAADWADAIEAQIEAVDHPQVEDPSVRRIVDQLRALEGDVGPAIRVHGDYHLGQVLRTDAGWFVLDFEGEPARPPEQRRRPTSPLKDVAGMLRSLHYASRVAVFERDESCATLAGAWETRNREAFLEGYMTTATPHGFLPDETTTETVLAAFELEKAVYELGYERAYRPDWQSIPLAALHRLAAI